MQNVKIVWSNVSWKHPSTFPYIVQLCKLRLKHLGIYTFGEPIKIVVTVISRLNKFVVGSKLFVELWVLSLYSSFSYRNGPVFLQFTNLKTWENFFSEISNLFRLQTKPLTNFIFMKAELRVCLTEKWALLWRHNIHQNTQKKIEDRASKKMKKKAKKKNNK